MKNLKIAIILVATITMLTAQVGTAFAAPALQEGNITGTVDTVTCETDQTTGAITFLVTVTVEDGTSQTVPVDEETAATLGIITSETVCNSDGTVDGAVTGLEVSIAPTEEEAQHPVGYALSLFFEGIADYETIMQAHDGEFEELGSTGFGVIAQAL
ncbi:MAG TPA: hypothetical protein VLT51_10250, partial [Anaerolineales bacterium]|nr:hypothetical protein [Anaerolineales bacterium]